MRQGAGAKWWWWCNEAGRRGRSGGWCKCRSAEARTRRSCMNSRSCGGSDWTTPITLSLTSSLTLSGRCCSWSEASLSSSSGLNFSLAIFVMASSGFMGPTASWRVAESAASRKRAVSFCAPSTDCSSACCCCCCSCCMGRTGSEALRTAERALVSLWPVWLWCVGTRRAVPGGGVTAEPAARRANMTRRAASEPEFPFGDQQR